MSDKEKNEIIKLLKSADLDKCNKNQLITIINLFDILKVPMKGLEGEK